MSIKPSRQSGITLVEQIVFIIIVSVGVVGLVSVLGPLVRHSADPMQTKQMAAIAESLLSEVIHQPFTWCDPGDAAASTAQSYGDCAQPQNTMGATAGESRGGVGENYDNVRDYAGFSINDVADPSGTSVVNGYRAEVNMAEVGTTYGAATNDAALAITVTVCRTPPVDCTGQESYSLTGYRFRYAPRI